MSRTRRDKQDRGSTLVEFALITPILLLLLFGIIEVGMAMYRQQGIHAASRDAARVGALPTVTTAQIEARALASLGDTFLDSPPVIVIEPQGETPCADAEQIVVTIEADNPMLIPFWEAWDVTLSSRAEFACEN